jgi:hypothetical protein
VRQMWRDKHSEAWEAIASAPPDTTGVQQDPQGAQSRTLGDSVLPADRTGATETHVFSLRPHLFLLSPSRREPSLGLSFLMGTLGTLTSCRKLVGRAQWVPVQGWGRAWEELS